MMNQKQISDLFARKVPVSKCEDLIEELLDIAYNKEKEVACKNRLGTPMRDEFNRPLMELAKPYSTTNQITAIKILAEYAIGKPGSGEPEQEQSKSGGVVILLPSNGR